MIVKAPLFSVKLCIRRYISWPANNNNNNNNARSQGTAADTSCSMWPFYVHSPKETNNTTLTLQKHRSDVKSTLLDAEWLDNTIDCLSIGLLTEEIDSKVLQPCISRHALPRQNKVNCACFVGQQQKERCIRPGLWSQNWCFSSFWNMA